MKSGFLRKMFGLSGQIAICVFLANSWMVADSFAANGAQANLAEDVEAPEAEQEDPGVPSEPPIEACPSQPPLQEVRNAVGCAVGKGGIVCVANPSRSAAASELFHYWGQVDCGKRGCKDSKTIQAQFTSTLTRTARSQPNSCYICGCLRLKGCFAPGTYVKHADGSERLVDDLRVGDQLWNPVKNEPYTVRRVMEGAEEIPLVELVAEATSLRVSQEHVIYTPDGFKRANEFAVGDLILRPDGSSVPLDAVREVPVSDGQYVINVELDGVDAGALGHLIESQGFVSGDLVLQNNLEELTAVENF